MRLCGRNIPGRVEEVSGVKLKIGGFEISVVEDGNGWAILTPLPNELFKTGLGEDSQLAGYHGKSVRLKEPRGTFSEQVLELVGAFSREFCLFPVKFTDAFTRKLINGRSVVEIYDEEWGNRPDTTCASFDVRFEGASEPTNVVLEIMGKLEIWDMYFGLWREEFGPVIEKKSRMIPSDRNYIETVLNKKAESIYARMQETLPPDKIAIQEEKGIIPAGIGLGDVAAGTFEVVAPIDGRQIIRWIVQAAMDCGVVFSETALAEWGLKLPEPA